MLFTAPESNVKQGVTSTVEDNYATNIFNFFITVFYLLLLVLERSNVKNTNVI